MQTGIQKFHRFLRIFKTVKYLLITHSFPHCPQVFPQELSTGKPRCGYSFLVHIKRRGSRMGSAHFLADSIFFSRFFVQKFGLDTEVAGLEKTEEFFKIGG